MSQSTPRYFLYRVFLAPTVMTSLLLGCGGGSSPAAKSDWGVYSQAEGAERGLPATKNLHKSSHLASRAGRG